MSNEMFWINSAERILENKVTIKEYISAKIDIFLNTSTLTPYRVLTRCKRSEIEELLLNLYLNAPPGRLAEYVWNHFENTDSTKSELVKLSMLLASIGEEVDKNRELLINEEKRSDEVLPLFEKGKSQLANEFTNETIPNHQSIEVINNLFPTNQKIEPSAFGESDDYPIPEYLSSSASDVHHLESSYRFAPYRRTRRALLNNSMFGSSSSNQSSSSAAPMMVIIPRPSGSNASFEKNFINAKSTPVENIRRSERQYSSTSRVTVVDEKNMEEKEEDSFQEVPTNSSAKTNDKNSVKQYPSEKPRRKCAVVGGLYNIMNGYHTTIRRIKEKLEKPELSFDQIEKHKAELNEVKNNLQKGVLQRTLNNKAKKHFSPVMYQRLLDGFVTYEAAVEFINHENCDIRAIMQIVMNETVANNSVFWTNAMYSRGKWVTAALRKKHMLSPK
uniref:Uncharacterized protein n=1 Tax=Panagrolaimus superbus TaxID=310955 RepID=A0A914YJI9_9BILA